MRVRLTSWTRCNGGGGKLKRRRERTRECCERRRLAALHEARRQRGRVNVLDDWRRLSDERVDRVRRYGRLLIAEALIEKHVACARRCDSGNGGGIRNVGGIRGGGGGCAGAGRLVGHVV